MNIVTNGLKIAHSQTATTKIHAPKETCNVRSYFPRILVLKLKTFLGTLRVLLGMNVISIKKQQLLSMPCLTWEADPYCSWSKGRRASDRLPELVQALFQTGSDLVLCQQLLDAQKELLADAALGVANMTQLLPSAMRMSETNIIEALCAILSDDDTAVPWFDIKMNALRALGELCRVIPKAALSLVEPNTFGALRDINRKYKDDPIEAQRLAVQCYINLLSYTVSTRAMLNSSFIAELIRILRRPDIQLKIMACTVLTGLMKERLAQGIFTKLDGETVVSLNLKIEHVGLRTALCLLIVASVTDEGADVYLNLGTVHYMIENRMARFAVSVWESALESIFRHHASAKLAYTGRLDINDFTQDGFYVEKRLSPRFPSMKEVLNREPPNKEPVFVCLFERVEPEVPGPSPQHTRRQSTLSHISASPNQRILWN